jgi:hypothetical protein
MEWVGLAKADILTEAGGIPMAQTMRRVPGMTYFSRISLAGGGWEFIERQTLREPPVPRPPRGSTAPSAIRTRACRRRRVQALLTRALIVALLLAVAVLSLALAVKG